MWGHEWVNTCWENLVTDVSIETGLLADPEGDLLSNVVKHSVVISEFSEEFLEEYATKDDILGLRSILIQVSDIQIAKLDSFTFRRLLLSKRSHWDSHVVALISVFKPKPKYEVVVNSVVFATALQQANTVQCVLTSCIIRGSISRVGIVDEAE